MSSSTGQAPGAQRPLVVGFDLDMTLIDARAGIRAAWLALSRETGVPVDADLVVTRLGPPVETEVANWFPSEDVERVAARYRAIYAEVGATGVVAMPGAESALAAVRAQHGSIVAVTAKHQPNARLNVAHLGLDLDEVIGDQWAEAKGHALAQRGGSIYVGDHVHDVLGARTAERPRWRWPPGPARAPTSRPPELMSSSTPCWTSPPGSTHTCSTSGRRPCSNG
jgi:phosphoglycolate phosphatase